MRKSEWVGEVVARINANWPHQVVPDESLAKWYDDLAELDVREVVAAVEALYREGREFPPNGGIIRRKAIELAADAPEWSEVWAWVRRYIRTGVANPMYRQSNYRVVDEASHPPNVAARLRDRMPPLVARFVETVGDRQLAEACDQEGGGEARLREKWLSWERRAEREAGLLGLDSGLAQVERVNREPRGIAALIEDITGRTYGPDFEIEPAKEDGR